MKQPIILIVMLLISYASTAQDSDTTARSDERLGPGEVAFVNGQRIPESIFRLYTLGALQVNPDDLTPEARTEIVNRLINTVLLAQEAERVGLPDQRRVAAELEIQRLQILARYMSDRFVQRNPPTDAELRAVYQENLQQLARTEYKVRHILVESKEEAEDLIEELDDDEDFEELARENSIAADSSEGGNLGWLSVDSAIAPFAAALIDATPGTHISTPVETEYGWHVIRVDESREAPPPSMEDIRDDLVAAIATQRLAAYAESLRESGEVEIVE